MTHNPLAGVYADLDRLLARQVSEGLLEQARRLLVDAHRVGHQQGMLDTIQRVADPADRDRLRSELLPSPRSPRRSPW